MTAEVQSAPPWLRRHAGVLLIGGGLVLAVLGMIVLGGADPARTDPLDPENAGPSGAQAVARVLEQMGVDVTVVRSADDLEAVELEADSVVVTTSSDQLGKSTTDRLVKHAKDVRLIFVNPVSSVTDSVWTSRPLETDRPVKNLRGSCGDARFDDLVLEVDTAFTYSGTGGCFPHGGRAMLQNRGNTTMFGAGDALTNDQVLRDDNAAIALRLLGQGDRLVWYVPRIQDVDATAELEPSPLPRWLSPALWTAVVATIALIVWRSRRLGPLAVEPLPVVVKAIETTESRGRLYRKAGDRQHAAKVLRAAARSRAASRLGARPADHEVVVRGIAKLAGRSAAEVEVMIDAEASPPVTDRELLDLAAALNDLDREAGIHD